VAGRIPWRYVPPNAVTAASIVFAVIAVQTSVDGRPVSAAWWGLLVLLTDKLDGLLAGLLKARSNFGVQLDSMADLISFGVVPATVFWAFYSRRPELGWAEGGGRLALHAICAAYVVMAALRLARFNVIASAGPIPHYTGLTSTMTAGTVQVLFLTCLKYSDPSLVAPETIEQWRWLGGLRLEAAVRWLPLVLLAGGAGMLTRLRVPKLGRAFHPVATAILMAAVVFGYAMGLTRRLPEYLLGGALYYLGICVAYHLRTREATS
jgi:CDP-diacylglycerol---serine O-phosphatidyltransferase